MALQEPEWPAAREAARRGEPLGAEAAALALADRRVLASDAGAMTDLPAFDTSAMDGWAVAGAGPWPVIGAVLAGAAPQLRLAAGQACLIATGAALPEGADAVVRREDGAVRAGLLQAAAPAAGAHIRPRGEECRTGEVLAQAGAVVGPAMIGMLAAAGLDSVWVRRRPRVRIVLFGDELAAEGVAGPGRVRDALGPQLPGWLDRMGAWCAGTSQASDTLTAHVDAIRAAAADADIVVTTGGTAAGPVDHLHPAVAELGGRFVVDSVAVRPGHPMALADLGPDSPGARHLLGLPGNPQSAIVALLTLGAPLIDSLLGRPPAPLQQVRMTAAAAAPRHEHRLLACAVRGGAATPVGHLGSAMLRGLSAADGFAVLPPGGAAAGQEVGYLPLPA